MFRNNNNRTRSQILGLNRRSSGSRNSWEDGTPMTPASAPKRNNRTPASKPQVVIEHNCTEGFSEQEIFELNESFRLFDVDGTGTIEVGSVRSVLESLLDNEGPPYPHLEELLRILSDRSNKETIDFDEYVSIMACTTLQQRLQAEGSDDETNFQHVFDLFDLDRKGYITVEDLRRVAVELGESDMTTDELQEMIDRARSKKSGKVTVKEFSKIMKLNLFQKMEEVASSEGNLRPSNQGSN